MNNLKTLFYDNPLIEEEIFAFLAQDPQFIQAQQDFYETAEKIAQAVGFSMYDAFEQRLGHYISRISDVCYLFGLGLRRDVLEAME